MPCRHSPKSGRELPGRRWSEERVLYVRLGMEAGELGCMGVVRSLESSVLHAGLYADL